MTRLRKNLIVDVLSYIGFVLLLGTGLILEYILPHGSGRVVGRGTGHTSGEKLITTLWGMTGEQWGEIHFWIAVGMLIVLTFHLVLHWKWITCILGRKEKPAGASGGRAFLGLAGMFGILALVLLPFLFPTEQTARIQILEQREARQAADTSGASGSESNDSKDRSETDDISIRGTMTLMEIQDKTGVPYEHILAELGVPKDTPPNEKLGRLRATYGFSTEDVRRVVKAYKQ